VHSLLTIDMWLWRRVCIAAGLQCALLSRHGTFGYADMATWMQPLLFMAADASSVCRKVLTSAFACLHLTSLLQAAARAALAARHCQRC
jgi:hypothetical protein